MSAMSDAAPGECRLYLSQVDREDPFQVVVKWFPPSHIAVGSKPELRAFASSEKEVRSCLTRLGIGGHMAWVGELGDGTPLSEKRMCTVDELVHLLGSRARSGGLLRGWYTLLAPGVPPEDMMNRMQAWILENERT